MLHHYEWGESIGDSGSSGTPAAPTDAIFGDPEQASGNVVVAPTTINFTRATKWINVINTDVEHNLEVSFDSGVNYVPIVSGDSLKSEVSVTSILLRGNAAGTNYEIVAAIVAA